MKPDATVTMRRLRQAADVTVGGVPALDLAVALVLSFYAVALTSGVLHTGHRTGGIGASVAVLAMTLPVAYCRRAPVAAAAALAVGALANGLAYGTMVRCGAALPSVLIVAFFVAGRCDRGRAAVGVALCAVNVVAQAIWDPQLGPQALVVLLPVLGLFVVLGRIVRARTKTVESLRVRTAELRRRREQTARLTVLADRARVTTELDAVLGDRIERIAAIAAAGRTALEADPAEAVRALAAVEHEGREVLRQMREIVGSLDVEVPSEPQPSLAQLPTLLSRTTGADARLNVEGEPRRLPAGIELAGYRIAEHLLAALDDTPGATVDVRVRFADEALELDVSGPPSAEVEFDVVLAAARERAALHDGTVEERSSDGTRRATARLPLVVAHA